MKIIFVQFFCVLLHLFLIPYASLRSILFLSFIKPIFAWNVPFLSLISWRDLKSFPFCCFPLFLCIDNWRRLSYLFALLWNSAFKWEYRSFSPLLFASLLFTAICKASSDSHFAFLPFFFWGEWSWFMSPIQCHKPLSIVHLASIRSSPLNLFLTSTI